MLLGLCFYFYLLTKIFFSLILFLSKDIVNKRNPRLVPYNLLDEKTKKTNRDTVCSAVRTLIGYGYNIEPPDQESSKFLQAGWFQSLYLCLDFIKKDAVLLQNVHALYEGFIMCGYRCRWTRQFSWR